MESTQENNLSIQNTPNKEPVTYCDQLAMPDVARHNAQYPGVTLHAYNKAHDRFLIIDEEVYHIGHSLKDLGKKLFAFSKMDVLTGTELISQL